MEGTDRDADGELWSKLLKAGLISPYSSGSSYSSGTIVSTGYTFTGSHVSSISTESEARFIPFDYDLYPEQTQIKRKQQMESIVKEIFGVLPTSTSLLRRTRKLLGAALSANRSILERWLKELGVDWVLRRLPDAGAVTFEHTLHAQSQSWIWALAEITETIRLASASTFFSDRGSSLGLPSICEDDHDEVEPDAESGSKASVPDQLQYAQFIQETMSEMLSFVDAIVTALANRRGGPQEQEYGKLSTLLGVHDALSRASAKIRLSFRSSSTAQVQRIQGKTVSLLSVRQVKLGEAIWSTLKHIMTRVLESIQQDDSSSSSSSSQILQGSPDIHKATRSVTRHVSFLRSHYSPVNAVVSQAASLGKYVPHEVIVGDDQFPLNSMIVEMASCLEEKLVCMSESFPDQGLRFLFLLNNSYFIRERLLFLFLLNNSDFIRASPQKYSSLDIHVASLFEKVERYIDSYLHVSWTPVMSCLLDPTATTPLCFGSNYSSPLSKFESEFQKRYTTQKLWKVPDPQLRKMLREAIVDKIIPGYKKHIEDNNNVTTPKFTPQELQEMLRELFEG